MVEQSLQEGEGNDLREELQRKSGKAVTGYRLASKAELQKKARELEYFNQWKGSETVAIARNKDYKKYQAFINNPDNSDFSNYSYQQWRDLVEMLGSLGDELKGYDIFAVRISTHSYVGDSLKVISNGKGPDTGERLFSNTFFK